MSDVNEFIKNTNKLITDSDKIEDWLAIWSESNKMLKAMQELDERIKTKVKAYMKEKKWDKYQDEHSHISVSISKSERRSIDEDMVKKLLSKDDFDRVLKISSFERMNITTPEQREKLKKMFGG